MFKNLTPRSAAALAVVATCFFLMVCVSLHGGSVFTDVRAAQSAGVLARSVGWLVQTLGAGIWAILVLGMAWGVIVYFDERTPDLVMRFAGTMVLAVATSTIVGLTQGGLWAGHVGNGVAGALGAQPGHAGGLLGVLAWLVALALFGVSLLFATDWMFHTIRRAGRAAAAKARPIATEPVAAQLLDDPAEAEAREFVADTPHAAIVATGMNEILASTSVDAEAPSDWSAVEEEGRMIVAPPSGYKGVEFLPPSDELALPEASQRPATTEVAVSPAAASPVPQAASALFEDEHFVATSEAAFFVEADRDADSTDESESETEEIGGLAVLDAADEMDDEDPVADAVWTLFEAVTTSEPVPVTEPETVTATITAPIAEPVPTPAVAEAAAAGGIGFPEDSPFHDEFFASEAGWPFASEPETSASDGASAANEMASSYAATPAAAIEPTAAAPAARFEESAAAFEDDQVSIDEILVSRLPDEAFDEALPLAGPAVADVVPASTRAMSEVKPEPIGSIADVEWPAETPIEVEPRVVEAVSARVVAEPAPQLSLFAETVGASSPAASAAVATLPDIDLSRLHTIELDPLFHDAVGAVLERGRASAVVLQRQLGIGYARGIRILDQMTVTGLVGPDTPTGSREIRVTREAWQTFAG